MHEPAPTPLRIFFFFTIHKQAKSHRHLLIIIFFLFFFGGYISVVHNELSHHQQQERQKKRFFFFFLLNFFTNNNNCPVTFAFFYTPSLFLCIAKFAGQSFILSLFILLNVGLIFLYNWKTFLGCFCLDTKWLVIWRLFICGFIEKVRVFQLLLPVWFINSW